MLTELANHPIFSHPSRTIHASKRLSIVDLIFYLLFLSQSTSSPFLPDDTFSLRFHPLTIQSCACNFVSRYLSININFLVTLFTGQLDSTSSLCFRHLHSNMSLHLCTQSSSLLWVLFIIQPIYFEHLARTFNLNCMS